MIVLKSFISFFLQLIVVCSCFVEKCQEFWKKEVPSALTQK